MGYFEQIIDRISRRETGVSAPRTNPKVSKRGSRYAGITSGYVATPDFRFYAPDEQLAVQPASPEKFSSRPMPTRVSFEGATGFNGERVEALQKRQFFSGGSRAKFGVRNGWSYSVADSLDGFENDRRNFGGYNFEIR